MKFLYGINTNGQGHLTRAEAIILQMLKDGHHVDIIFSGPPPPKYAYHRIPNYAKTLTLKGWPLKRKGNSVDIISTIFSNISGVINIANTIYSLKKLTVKKKYDAIITDLDPHTSRLGRSLGIPIISIDNQHSIIHPGITEPSLNYFKRFSLIFLLKLTIPHRDYYFAFDFIKKIIKTDKGCLYPLLQLPEFDRVEPRVEDYFLVYLPQIPIIQILQVLQKFPAERFIVYGHNREIALQNIILKSTNRMQFVRDMAKSKGIISNSGFTIISETIMLNKLILLIPLKFHYEQYYNAKKAHKMGIGLIAEDINKSILSKFFEFCKFKNYYSDPLVQIIPIKKFTSTLFDKIVSIN